MQCLNCNNLLDTDEDDTRFQFCDQQCADEHDAGIKADMARDERKFNG